MTLTDFLLARIAEDEAVAQEATAQHWDAKIGGEIVAGYGDLNDGVLLGDMLDGPSATHLIRHDPARVLAECEAKRRIVEEHYYMPGHQSRDFGFEDGNCVTCRKQGPCATLRLLALPYADHPDYREEWKP